MFEVAGALPLGTYGFTEVISPVEWVGIPCHATSTDLKSMESACLPLFEHFLVVGMCRCWRVLQPLPAFPDLTSVVDEKDKEALVP